MRLAELAGLRHSAVTSASNDPGEIANALQGILNGSRSFTHREKVTCGRGTTYVYLQAYCCRNSEPLPTAESEAGSIAQTLCELAVSKGTRYPPRPHGDRRKGWRIRQVRLRGRLAAIVEAAWI